MLCAVAPQSGGLCLVQRHADPQAMDLGGLQDGRAGAPPRGGGRHAAHPVKVMQKLARRGDHASGEDLRRERVLPHFDSLRHHPDEGEGHLDEAVARPTRIRVQARCPQQRPGLSDVGGRDHPDRLGVAEADEEAPALPGRVLRESRAEGADVEGYSSAPPIVVQDPGPELQRIGPVEIEGLELGPEPPACAVQREPALGASGSEGVRRGRPSVQEDGLREGAEVRLAADQPVVGDEGVRFGEVARFGRGVRAGRVRCRWLGGLP